MPVSTSTLRILQPCPGLFAYYDGRVGGRRLHSPDPNWLDDGAYDLGTASYALVDGGEALVYDTHVSVAHAEAIRAHLGGLGVTAIRVALSHWHADHVAGNEVFADCEIIALERTAAILLAERDALGHRTSADGAVLWLPDEGVLLAGDTLEDTVTYVAEPDRIATHLRELDRLRTWPIRRILPNHGDPDRIADGGYEPSLVEANARYLRRLIDPEAGDAPLDEAIAEDLASGAVTYFAPYEAIHRRNVAAVRAVGAGPSTAVAS